MENVSPLNRKLSSFNNIDYIIVEENNVHEFLPLTSINISSLNIQNNYQESFYQNYNSPRRFRKINLRKIAQETKVKRRKVANAREKRRMAKLNEAFDKLRKFLPTSDENRPLSKYETLLMAQTYIIELSKIMEWKKKFMTCVMIIILIAHINKRNIREENSCGKRKVR